MHTGCATDSEALTSRALLCRLRVFVAQSEQLFSGGSEPK